MPFELEAIYKNSVLEDSDSGEYKVRFLSVNPNGNDLNSLCHKKNSRSVSLTKVLIG
jgi:hypothetical protein